jgi:hypothetical protein
MTLEEIDALTLEEVFNTILQRVVDFSIVPDGETKFILADVGATKYERLILNSKIIRPQLSEFESDLEIYKEELRFKLKEEELKAIEDARVVEWKSRLDALPNLREIAEEQDFSESNIETLKYKFIKNKTLTDLENLEALSATKATEKEQLDAIWAKVERGKEIRELCLVILDLVTGFNDESGLDETTLDAMEEELEPIRAKLAKNRPMKAKKMIEGVTNPAYAQLKTVILSLYTRAGY